MRSILPATVALVLVAAASAQAPSQSPQQVPSQSPPPAEQAASMRGFGDADKTCQEWNDGCVTCRRPDAGEAVCSNIGIACQPQAISCTRRAEEKKAEDKK